MTGKERMLQKKKEKARRRMIRYGVLLGILAVLIFGNVMIILNIANQYTFTFSIPKRETIRLEFGEPFDQSDVTAEYQGTIFHKTPSEVSVKRTGSIDYEKLGTYTLTYQASACGRKATAVRVVTVEDTTAPKLELNGDAAVSVAVGQTFEDPGCTAYDLYDGDRTDSVTVDGTVDVSTDGTYTLTYSVSDSSGNTASVTRTVTVGTGGGREPDPE